MISSRGRRRVRRPFRLWEIIPNDTRSLCQICARALPIWLFQTIWPNEEPITYLESETVGAPIPSLATMFSITYKPKNRDLVPIGPKTVNQTRLDSSFKSDVDSKSNLQFTRVGIHEIGFSYNPSVNSCGGRSCYRSLRLFVTY